MKAAFVLLAILCGALPVYADTAQQVFEKVRSSVVTITTFDERSQVDGEGSGIVLGASLVVTNCHVVHEANAIQVHTADKKFSATLVSKDVNRDLCLLQVAELKAPAVRTRSSDELVKGEMVYAIGNPLGFGLSVSSGLISIINRSKGETQIYTSAPISPGSSGGGLFDSQGQLVGITTRLYFGAQNFNVALPAEWVVELVKKQNKEPLKTLSKPGPDPDWETTAGSLKDASGWGKLSEWAQRWRAAWPTSARADAYFAIALFNLQQTREAKEMLDTALQKDPRNLMAFTFLPVVRRSLGDKKTAYEDLQRALVLVPSAGYLYRIMAVWQKEDGNIDEALKSIEKALRFSPWEWESWQFAGEFQYLKQDFQEAEKSYRTALRLKPDDLSSTINLCSTLVFLGKIDEARRLLATIPGNLPNAATWLKIGLVEENNQRYMEAEEAYRKALELNSADPEALSYLGIALLRRHSVKDGEDALRRAVKLKPGLGIAWFNLGLLFGGRGEKEEAKNAFAKATAAEPTFFPAWHSLGVSLSELRDFPGAAAALEKATQIDPTKSGVWAALGDIQLRLGHAEEGLKSLKKAERLDPRNENAIQGLSMYYGKIGDYTRALFYTDQALELNAASANSWSNKGYTLLKMKRYPEAEQAFDTAIRLQPDFANAWINLGETYMRQNKADKAIATFEKALQMAPASTDARFYVAQVYAGTGQRAKAQNHVETLLQQAPTFPAAWFMQTTFLMEQNKKTETLAAYSKLKALDPKMAKELRERFSHGNQQFDLPE